MKNRNKWIYILVWLSVNLMFVLYFVSMDTWLYWTGLTSDTVNLQEVEDTYLQSSEGNMYLVKGRTLAIIDDAVRYDGNISLFDPFKAKFYAFSHKVELTGDTLGKNVYYSYPTSHGFDSSESIGTFRFSDYPLMSEPFGIITGNNDFGISGDLIIENLNNPTFYSVPKAERIKFGFAQIIATLEFGTTSVVDVLILYQQTEDIYLFKIVDDDYLEDYQSILYGMSGSPIVQDGKLIGGVTGASPEYNDIGFMTSIESIIE